MFSLFIKEVIETNESKTKEQMGRLLSVPLILGASLLLKMLAEKRVIRAGNEFIQPGDGVFGSRKDSEFLILTNFEIPKYCRNKLKFKGVLSRNNLPDTVKDDAFVVNLGEYKSIATHWIAC